MQGQYSSRYSLLNRYTASVRRESTYRGAEHFCMTGTLFKQVNYTVASLVEFIDLGQIGLPDIQRPFVWRNTKVRELS